VLKEERQSKILEVLKTNGKVVATELSLLLEVSEDTIRRDLRDLSNLGQIHRVHGGGLPHSPAAASYQERLSQAGPLKRRIASAAVKHIQAGDVVFLDGGTTNLQVAQLFPQTLHATIITNSPAIATAVSEYQDLTVILVGGKLDKLQQVVTGAVAEASLRAYHPDVCLLGVCSLHPVAGITVPDLEESSFKSCLISQSDQVIALVSPEKLDTASAFHVGSISDLDLLITTQPDDPKSLDSYRESGITLELV
jgi:DeoR/GlpR family transcriptional regulator of sugar metabolism